MALTRITKGVIKPNENYDTHNINSTGIITAIGFKGPFTGSSDIQSGIITATKIDLNGDIDVDGHTNLDNVSIAGVVTATTINATTFAGAISGTTGTFSGNVSIGGTLTYEDVTNIDSVGVVTARNGLKVLAGISTFSGTVHVGAASTIETNGNASFAGITTFGSYNNNGQTYFDSDGNLRIPTTRYLSLSSSGGTADPHRAILKYESASLSIQSLNQMQFNCWDGNSYEYGIKIQGVGGSTQLGGSFMGNNGARQPLLNVAGHTTQTITMSSSDGTNLTERFRLSQGGFNFTGLSTHTGNFDLDGDLDVDGHTNLDNVSVAGVSTFTGAIDANGALDVAGVINSSTDVRINGSSVIDEAVAMAIALG